MLSIDKAPKRRLIIHLVIMLVGVVVMEALLFIFTDPRPLIRNAQWWQALASIIDAPPPMRNVQWWQALANIIHENGIFNVWTPYPPVFTVLFAGLTAIVPAAYIENVWQVANTLLLLGQALIIFLIVRFYHKGNREQTLPTALMAGLAFLLVSWRHFGLVLLGPRMDQFDYLPTFLLLLGLLLLLSRREKASAVVCGIGIMTKIFPGLLILLAFATLPFRRAVRYAALALAVCIIIALPFVIGNSEMFMSGVRYMADRQPWESVWAYVTPGYGVRDPVANIPDVPHPDVAAHLFTQRYMPGDLGYTGLANRISLLVGVVLLGGIVYLTRERRLAAADGSLLPLEHVVRTMLLLTVAFLVANKGFSSYFIVWIIPFICMAYPGAKGLLLSATLILASNLQVIGLTARLAEVFQAEDAIVFFTRIAPARFSFWYGIFLRQIILVFIGVDQAYRLWNDREVKL